MKSKEAAARVFMFLSGFSFGVTFVVFIQMLVWNEPIYYFYTLIIPVIMGLVFLVIGLDD